MSAKSEQPPQEIIDHIISFVPRLNLTRTDCPSKTLLACTNVSRSFAIASRRRIFSHLYLFAASKNTSSRLSSLIDLLEHSPDLLHAIRVVEIKVNRSNDRKWPASNDELLHRILTIIQGRPQKLGWLKIDCCISRSYTSTFGPLTQEVIRSIIPSLEALSLTVLYVPESFFEGFPPLRALMLNNVSFASSPTIPTIPPITFPPRSMVVTDLESLEEIHRWYQRSQQLPAYTKLTIQTFDLSWGAKLDICELLEGSSTTLETLDLQTGHYLRAYYARLDIGLLTKLTSLRVVFNAYEDEWLSIWNILEFVDFALESTINHGPLTSASSISSLVNIEFEFGCGGSISNLPALDDEDVHKGRLLGLAPNQLLTRNPSLRFVTLKICLPEVVDHGERATLVLRSEVKRCLEKHLANLVGPSNWASPNEKITYNIQVDLVNQSLME